MVQNIFRKISFAHPDIPELITAFCAVCLQAHVPKIQEEYIAKVFKERREVGYEETYLSYYLLVFQKDALPLEQGHMAYPSTLLDLIPVRDILRIAEKHIMEELYPNLVALVANLLPEYFQPKIYLREEVDKLSFGKLELSKPFIPRIAYFENLDVFHERAYQGIT